MKKVLILMIMFWSIVTLGRPIVDDTLLMAGSPPPTASLSGYYSVCLGSNVSIPVYLTNGGPTWDITFSDGLTQWTVTGVTTSPYMLVVSPTSVRTYTVTTINNGLCLGTSTGAATVSIAPQPQIFTVSSASTSFCQGGTSSPFINNGSVVGDTYQLLWGGSSVVGATTSGTGASISLPGQSLPGTYTIKATNTTGCSSLMNGSITLVANPLPSSATTITGPSTAICEGTSASFSTNTILNATNYIWSVPAGATITTNQGTTITVLFGAISGTVSVFGQNACGGGQPALLPVTVNPAPAVTVTAINSNICKGTNAVLTANTSATSFSWSTGGTTQSITNIPQITTTYTVTVTGTNGCTNTGNITINVNPLPTVTFSLAQDHFCTDTNSVVVSGGLPLGGTYSGNCIFPGNMVYPAITGTGTYNVTYTYTDANGCMANATDLLTINPIPAVMFTNITSAIFNDTPPFDLMGNVSPSGGIFIGPGMVGSTFSPAIAGVGTHMITYIYTHPITGCDASQIQYISVGNHGSGTGIDETTTTINPRIYPNPAMDRITIDNIPETIQHISIVNILGSVVYTTPVTNDKVLIDVADFATGTYIVQFQTPEGVSQRKMFIKQ